MFIGWILSLDFMHQHYFPCSIVLVDPNFLAAHGHLWRGPCGISWIWADDERKVMQTLANPCVNKLKLALNIKDIQCSTVKFKVMEKVIACCLQLNIQHSDMKVVLFLSFHHPQNRLYSGSAPVSVTSPQVSQRLCGNYAPRAIVRMPGSSACVKRMDTTYCACLKWSPPSGVQVNQRRKLIATATCWWCLQLSMFASASQSLMSDYSIEQKVDYNFV